MSYFITITEANCKPAKTLRKPPQCEEELTFLAKVRDVRLSVIDGNKTLVVIEKERDFESIFKNYSPSMKNYLKTGLLSIKTIDNVRASDLECSIFEIDRG